MYPCGYVPVRLHSTHGCGTAGTGGPEPAHGAGDPARPPGFGRRAGRRTADRPPRCVPAPASAAGGRTGQRSAGGAEADLQRAARAPRGRGRVAGQLPRALGEPARRTAHRDRSREEGAMNTIGTMRGLDETRGAVRLEDVYDTVIEDLWEACTTPKRLARWIAEVTGDLRVGGEVQVVFTSTWTGPARIEVCDAPHHLLLTMLPGSEDEGELE